MNAPVTAYIPSRDRYFTTLPSAILSVIQQTVKPQKFILFMDGEHLDLRDNPLYYGLFRMLELNRIEWEVVLSPRRGLVANHQHAWEMAKTEWIWRIDDDTFAEPTALERMLSCDAPDVGAIAGIVIDPKFAEPLPPGVRPVLRGLGRNFQWFFPGSPEVIEAEHLYSTFIYRKKAGEGCCCLELSPVSHREDTIFSHSIYRKGWKLLINPRAITWHVRQPQGGIRTFQSHEYWTYDEKVFQLKVKEWGYKPPKLIVLDNGRGDHMMFRKVWPTIKERYKDEEIIVAACYPELLVEEGMNLISIAEASDMCVFLGRNMDDFNVYKFCIDHNWKGPLWEAFLEMYK